jgi:hypothetical protein
MRTRFARLVVVVAAALPVVTLGAESPHDEAFTSGECNHCHSLYDPTVVGGTDYTSGCISCHGNRSGANFGFPWLPTDQAKPGVGGAHHSWSGYADNGQMMAERPVTLGRYLAVDQLQCATCHQPHYAAPETAGGKQHTSIAVGGNAARTGGPAPTSTGQLMLVAPGTVAKGYRLKVMANGTSFILTHTGASNAPTWLNWSQGTSSWIVGTDPGIGKPFTVGNTTSNDVTLDDVTVKVRWTGAPSAGDYWDFYVAYPFLRVANAADGMCVQCHKSMQMTHLQVEGVDPRYPVNGVRRFSHPVGEGLGANGRATDRTTILDATGVAQAANTGTTTDADGNATNDLRLDGTLVRCTTCHAVHHADSNSLSTDHP